MPTVNQFVAEPFTNEFGQTINPGEEVIYAGTSWKRTSLQKAIFEGVYYNTNWKGERVRVAVKCGGVPAKKFVWDEPYDHTKSDQKWHYEHYERKAILPLMRVFKIATPLAELSGTSF